MGIYGIYDRDYRNLTEAEKIKWEDLKKEEIVGTLGKLEIRKSKFREYPKAVRHYLSLFPNNYLDIVDLQKTEELNLLVEKFSHLLDEKNITERTIINFIKENNAYFIIASILKYYSFGHHDAYIFPEFQLGNSFKVDYVLVGQSSGGYEFIFVELEHPYKNIMLEDGNFGEAFRKGLNQIHDWKIWLEEYFPSLSETFEKYKNPNISLPREFMKPDRTRYHYVVVAGRRSHFEINKDKTYRLKREALENKIRILHYDNLCDSARAVIGQPTY